MDANEVANANADAETSQGITVEVSCRSLTREALSLSVDWDPKNMQCTRPISSSGTELTILSYGIWMRQTWNHIREFTNTIAQ